MRLHKMKLSNLHAVMMALALFGLIMSGCRGVPSDKPPINALRDMDEQPRYDPQGPGRFFDDGSAMRQPVPGSVPAGQFKGDPQFFQGRDIYGNLVAHSPAPLTMQELQRGRERFNIYCSPCHSRLGDGKGIMVERGYTPPPSFHSDRIRRFPDGQFFDVITHGVRAMPSYADQIPPADRWAIISYIRALQRSQNATLDDIPTEMRDRVR